MFNSNDEYFEAVEKFITDLQNTGHIHEAKIVSDGFSCINGLTDGWALYLEALIKIESSPKSNLSQTQTTNLKVLCDAAYKAVYRKPR